MRLQAGSTVVVEMQIPAARIQIKPADVMEKRHLPPPPLVFALCNFSERVGSQRYIHGYFNTVFNT